MGVKGLARWRRQRFARRVGVAVAFAALILTPRLALDGLRPIAPSEAELPICGLASCPDPGPAGWTARIEVLLETRAPEMPELIRRRVARAVIAESRRAGLDPTLAAAIIDVESGFDAGARSPRGALGLMQLRPSTMAGEASRHGLAAGDPGDPVMNVRLGIRYYARLLETFGREDRALMAYNAGPNRIAGYLERGAIPERFWGYPARVRAGQRRLRLELGVEPAPAVAEATPAAPWTLAVR